MKVVKIAHRAGYSVNGGRISTWRLRVGGITVSRSNIHTINRENLEFSLEGSSTAYRIPHVTIELMMLKFLEFMEVNGDDVEFLNRIIREGGFIQYIYKLERGINE